MIRREPHAVHQQLALVERTEIGRQRIAKADGANELVVDGIGDRDSVRVLFSGVDAILMADGNVRVGRGAGSLSCSGIADGDESGRKQQNKNRRTACHSTAPYSDAASPGREFFITATGI